MYTRYLEFSHPTFWISVKQIRHLIDIIATKEVEKWHVQQLEPVFCLFWEREDYDTVSMCQLQSSVFLTWFSGCLVEVSLSFVLRS